MIRPRPARLAALIPAILAAFLIAACGDETSSAPANFAPAAREAVPLIPLTAGDMPPGWQSTETGITDRVQLPDDCNVLDLDVAFPGASATAQGDALTGGLQQQVISFAAIYRDAADAQAALDGTGDLIDQCEDNFKDEVKRLAEDELQALGIDLGIFADINVSIDEQDVDLDADGDVAYRVAVTVGIPGADQHFTLDFFGVREGRAVGTVFYATFGTPNIGDEAAITSTLIAHAAEAESELPPVDEED
jgi:hypothetical protein